MSRFIYLYRGPAIAMDDKQGALWTAWMGKLGPAMLDMGAPFGGGTVVVDNGSSAKVSSTSGYTIVEAANLKAATALTAGNPLLAAKNGQHSIEIFELIEM